MVQRLLKQDWDMQTWPGNIQAHESSKATECPVDDDGDQVVDQVPVKGRYELAW